ncbi:dnaJ homolog subfamily C member 24 isoform X4 [Pseudoliparis swirei]|uniref:dnaJ homolog subfamily C member 24 isoform X4 n=1 Tax=Pseudoliparis swirei TaxID=2059687 RepID=UPI0024BD61CF|nr:dnaJ homolog subfamily C member 24 isoform X4 [Pseudoliparis swirei]
MTRIHFNKEFIQSTVLQQQVLNAAMSPLVLLQDGRWATLRQVSRWRRRCDVSVVFEAGMCEAAEKDLYAVLGSSPSDSVQQLRHRYQQLALQCHPDRLGGGSSSEAESGVKRFLEVDAAWRLLSDQSSRRQYDLRRRGTETGLAGGLYGPPGGHDLGPG